jgi:hypothetical protein
MKRTCVWGAICAALAAACSDGAVGELSLGHGTWGGAGGNPTDDASASSTDASPTDDASTSDASTSDASADARAHSDASHDAATAAPDSGSPDATLPTSAFAGTGAYASAPPAISAQGQHGFSLVGRNCADCHGGTSPSSGRRFDFAGRVFADPNGTTPATDVEVRVVDHNGVGASVHSDANGYFWHSAQTDLAIPAMAGARDANTTSLMVGALSDPVKRGGCNGCHNGTTTTYLHVP